jgi:hypothetical protein
MALSVRMLGLVQKVEAADAAHLASFRASATRDALERAKASRRPQPTTAKKPAVQKPLLRIASTHGATYKRRSNVARRAGPPVC